MTRHTFTGNPSTNAAARYSLALRRWMLAGGAGDPPTPAGEMAEALRRMNGTTWAEQAADNARAAFARGAIPRDGADYPQTGAK